MISLTEALEEQTAVVDLQQEIIDGLEDSLLEAREQLEQLHRLLANKEL